MHPPARLSDTVTYLEPKQRYTLHGKPVPPRQLSLWRCQTGALKYFNLFSCVCCPARWLRPWKQAHDSTDPLTGAHCVADLCEACQTPQAKLVRRIRYAVARCSQMSIAAPFLVPVDVAAYPDYPDVVKEPICLEQTHTRIKHCALRSNTLPQA